VANNNFGSAYGAANNMLSPNYAASLATSPQTQAAIQAAINPLAQQFKAQTIPGLRGAATSAGQRVGINGTDVTGERRSSAYDIPRANALTGLQANEGAIAGNIANQAYQTGLAQQANAINQIGNLAGTQAGIYNTAGANVAGAQGAQAGALNQVAQTSGQLT